MTARGSPLLADVFESEDPMQLRGLAALLLGMAPGLRAWLGVVLLAVGTAESPAQTVLYEFTDPPRYPHGGLVTVGERLYGVNAEGYGGGTVFSFSYAMQGCCVDFPTNIASRGPLTIQDGFVYAVSPSMVHRRSVSPFFGSYADGSWSTYVGTWGEAQGGLTVNGGFVYGVTRGGSNPFGGIFRLNVADGGGSIVATFNGTNGSDPNGSMVAVDGALYGTTQTGGASSLGTVFRYDLTSSTITTLVSFNGANGRTPLSELIASGGFLYGTTSGGGASNFGTVFRVNVSTGQLTTLLSFDGSNGRTPIGGLTLYDGLLYGTASGGGAQGRGTLFAVNPTTGFVTALHSFIANTSPGETYNVTDGPDATLHLFSLGGVSVLYGTSSGLNGGRRSDGGGTIFRFHPATSTLTTIHEFFIGGPWIPVGALVVEGQFAYGIAAAPGVGVVYRMDMARQWEQGWLEFRSFTSTTGSDPVSGMVMHGGTLYGTMPRGGAGLCGTAYKVHPSTLQITRLASFGGSLGCTPKAPLVERGGYLYGTTESGGASGVGTVFRIDPALGSVTTIGSMVAPSSYPTNGLTSAGQFLFGTTRGSWPTPATVFKVDPATGVVTTIASLDPVVDGTDSNGRLALSDGYLYGTTESLGPSGYGSVFRVHPDTGQVMGVFVFRSWPMGVYARASVTPFDQFLFGTTSEGGANGYGTVFKLDLAGNRTILWSFTNSFWLQNRHTMGAFPAADLTVSGAYLYGTTTRGGRGGGGLIFSTNTPPLLTIAPQGTLTAGDAEPSTVTLGTLSDAEDGPEAINVKASASTLTVTDVANGSGTITAKLQSPCGGPSGLSFVSVRALDRGFGFADGTYRLSVAANPAPVLGSYSDVSIDAAAPPSTITVHPSDGVAPSDNGTLTVSVDAPALAGTVAINPATGVLTISNTSLGTHTIEIVATDQCGLATRRTFRLIRDHFGSPQHFQASAIGLSSVGLTWQPVGGNASYAIHRKSNRNDLGWTIRPVPAGQTSFVDQEVSTGVTYLYKVVATILSGDGSPISADSAIDIATTLLFTDDPLSPGMVVKAAHFNELRTAVNAVRAAAALPAGIFADHPLTQGAIIRAVHLEQLRAALAEARQTLGLTAVSYSDSPALAGVTLLRAAHLTELRGGVQ